MAEPSISAIKPLSAVEIFGVPKTLMTLGHDEREAYFFGVNGNSLDYVDIQTGERSNFVLEGLRTIPSEICCQSISSTVGESKEFILLVTVCTKVAEDEESKWYIISICPDLRSKQAAVVEEREINSVIRRPDDERFHLLGYSLLKSDEGYIHCIGFWNDFSVMKNRLRVVKIEINETNQILRKHDLKERFLVHVDETIFVQVISEDKLYVSDLKQVSIYSCDDNSYRNDEAVTTTNTTRNEDINSDNGSNNDDNDNSSNDNDKKNNDSNDNDDVNSDSTNDNDEDDDDDDDLYDDDDDDYSNSAGTMTVFGFLSNPNSTSFVYCSFEQCLYIYCFNSSIGGGCGQLWALDWKKDDWKNAFWQQVLSFPEHPIKANASMEITSDGLMILHGDCSVELCPNSAHIYILEAGYYNHFDKGWNLKQLSEKFQFIRNLGSGASGEVKKYRNSFDGCNYAIKCITPAENYKEVKAIVKLRTHPFIVTYHDSWTDPAIREDELTISQEVHLFIQMELCDATLHVRLAEDKQRIENETAADWSIQLLLALRYMHDHGIVHGDIWDKNIFLSGETVKIGDFGLTSSANKRYSQGFPRTATREVDYKDLVDVILDIFSKTGDRDSPWDSELKDEVIEKVRFIMECGSNQRKPRVQANFTRFRRLANTELSTKTKNLIAPYFMYLPHYDDPDTELTWIRAVQSLLNIFY